MAEPPLYLHGVPPLAREEERRARVAECVEADPRVRPAALLRLHPLADPGRYGSRLEDALHEVRLLDARALFAREHEVVGLGLLLRLADPQLLGQTRGERERPAAVLRLRTADATA